MRTCPKCAFLNEDRFPTCVWCNTSLADIASVAPADPSHPEHARREQAASRTRLVEGKARFAAILYASVVTFTAVVPGMIFSPGVLALYWLSGFAVALGARSGVLGQFTACLTQGALTGALVIIFGPLQPGTFYVVVGHLTLAAVLWHWMKMIFDTHG